jgi:hypothetical protein
VLASLFRQLSLQVAGSAVVTLGQRLINPADDPFFNRE